MFLVKDNIKNSKIRFKHIIHFEIMNPRTYASYVLLKEYYNSLEDKMTKYGSRLEWIRFSRLFLTRILHTNGTLVCNYCSRPNLIIEYEGMVVKHYIKATIDHIKPTSNGGEQYNINNMCVSCGRCNGRKSNKPLNLFLKNIVK